MDDVTWKNKYLNYYERRELLNNHKTSSKVQDMHPKYCNRISGVINRNFIREFIEIWTLKYCIRC